jgi:hypothetical protein
MIALRHIEILDLGRGRRGRWQHNREDQSSEGKDFDLHGVYLVSR